MFSSVVHCVQHRLLGRLHSVVEWSRRPQRPQLTTSPDSQSYVQHPTAVNEDSTESASCTWCQVLARLKTRTWPREPAAAGHRSRSLEVACARESLQSVTLLWRRLFICRSVTSQGCEKERATQRICLQSPSKAQGADPGGVQGEVPRKRVCERSPKKLNSFAYLIVNNSLGRPAMRPGGDCTGREREQLVRPPVNRHWWRHPADVMISSDIEVWCWDIA